MIQVFAERCFRINYKVKCNDKTVTKNEKQVLSCIRQKIGFLQKTVAQCNCFEGCVSRTSATSKTQLCARLVISFLPLPNATKSSVLDDAAVGGGAFSCGQKVKKAPAKSSFLVNLQSTTTFKITKHELLLVFFKHFEHRCRTTISLNSYR